MNERRDMGTVGRRGSDHQCPVDNCGEVQSLVKENRDLKKRVTNMGIVSLGVLTIVVTVLLYMASTTLTIAQGTAANVGGFIEEHTKGMLRSENLHATFMAQMGAQAQQIQTVSEIQLAVVQEVSILKKGRVTK